MTTASPQASLEESGSFASSGTVTSESSSGSESGSGSGSGSNSSTHTSTAVADPAVKVESNTKKRIPMMNSQGYFLREKTPRTRVDKFYHRLLHEFREDSFKDSIVHDSFFHPTVCSEWVQDYRVSLNSRPALVCFPLVAMLDLALAGWLKTVLIRSGSLDQSIDPCKSFAYLVLHSVWSPYSLLPVKAHTTAPHAPRLWTIVDNCPGEQGIEIFGQNVQRVKKLLFTCEGCHIPESGHGETASAINVRGGLPPSMASVSIPESDCLPSSLPEPASIFHELGLNYVAVREAIQEGSLISHCAGACPSISPSSERIQYGPAFVSNPIAEIHCNGQLGGEDFLLTSQVSIESLLFMKEQYLIPPPLLEIMFHQVLNVYFSITSTTVESNVNSLPRAMAIEGFFVKYHNLTKLFSGLLTCSIMITTSRSTNVHEYCPDEMESETNENVMNCDQDCGAHTRALNLDCTLISADGDIVAHAYNVLYFYDIKDISDQTQAEKFQTLGFLNRMESTSHIVGECSTIRPRRSDRKNQKKQQQKSVNSSCVMTADHVNTQVRSIALMFLDGAPGGVISDEASLQDYGLDSLATSEFIGKLSATFQINLPPTLVFNHPTIVDIQQHIIGLLLIESNVENEGPERLLSVEELPSVAVQAVSESEKTIRDIDQTFEVDLDLITLTISSDEESNTIEPLSSDDDVVVVVVDEHDVDTEGDGTGDSFSPAARTPQSRAGHPPGNILDGNPWFSVFFAADLDSPRCRMVLFTGQAQGTAPWCSFVEILNQAGIDVYLVRIPGQFERGEEPLYEGGFADIVEGVCSGLADLGCLNDENGIPLSLPDQKRNDVQQHAHEFTRKSPAIPLVMLGFSLGTCFTIGLVQHLQRSRGIEVSQVVSMGGLTHSKMKSLKSHTVAYTPDLLKETLLEFFGRAPGGLHQFLETADDESITTIMRYFDEGFRFAREWMADMDSNNLEMQYKGMKNLLQTDFLWIVGSRDISCPSSDPGWKEFIGKDNQMEVIVYPGDHFFHVENPDADRAVAVDVSRCLLRKLQVYS